MKWLVRGIVVMLAVALLLAAAASAFVWHLGADAITRGKAAGWVAEAESAPLTVFEQTAAKALFGNTWNRSGFPCRTLARILTGERASAPISYFVARDMVMDVAPEGTLQTQLKVISAACQLENTYNDTALLRLWLSRFPLARHENPEAAAEALIGKSLAQLDDAEAARLIALVQAPSAWKDPAKWDKTAQDLLTRARDYAWVGQQLERGDAATR